MPAIFSFPRGKAHRGTVLRFSLLGTALMLASVLAVTAYLQDPGRSVAAAVAVPQVVAASSERGYIYQILVRASDRVEAGQTLITIKRRAEPRSQTAVTSPCSCQILEIRARRGEDTIEGEPLVYLAPLRADDLVVEAVFPAGVTLAVGETVEVKFEGIRQAGRGRIRAIWDRSEVAGLYGLPASLLEMSPDQQIIIVGELSSIPEVRPGDAAVVTPNWQMPFSDRILQEVLDVFARPG